MRILALTVVFMSVSANLAAQEPARSLERIMLALERSPLIVRDKPSEESQRTMDRQVRGSSVFETLPGRPKLGPLEFVAPQFRGEFVRLALRLGAICRTDSGRSQPRSSAARSKRLVEMSKPISELGENAR